VKSQRTKRSLGLVVLTSLGGVLCLAAAGKGAFGEAKVSGTTFYVDSRGGNDANTGMSPAAAWQTLDRVNGTTFKPGDQILLKSSSVFRGQLWPKGSGTEGHPIRVDMYGGGVKPVIKGDGLFEDTLLLKNQENWEIANLEVTNMGAQRAQRRGVHIALENYGEAHHIHLRSLTIHDVNGVDEVKPNGGISYTSTSESKPSRFVDLRIENNEIYHVDRSGFRWRDTVYRQALQQEGRENTSRTMVEGIFGETEFRRASRLTGARCSRTIARPTSEEVYCSRNGFMFAQTYEHPRNCQTRESIDCNGVSHDQPSSWRATATWQAGVPGATKRRAPRATESPKAPSTS
jgi:hypothetical protein